MSLTADAMFRESRWRRAGATDKQVDQLRNAHAALSVDEQIAEGQRIDTISDTDLAAELAGGQIDPTAGTADEVIARVGDDRDLAAVALSHEQAKARPRKTVVDALTALIYAAADQDG